MPVRSVTLWPTAACNLDCAYCYRGDQAGVMSLATAQAAVDLAAASGQPFHVQFAGGEPTLRPEVIEAVCARIVRDRLPATIALQTNATCLTDEVIALLHRYPVQVGVSVDGPPDVQDALRGRARQTFAGLQRLSVEGIPVHVTAVVSAASVMRLEELAVLLAGYANVRGLALDPLVPLGAAAGRPDLAPGAAELTVGIRALHAVVVRLASLRCAPFAWRELNTVRRALRRSPAGGEPTHGSTCASAFCHAALGQSIAVAPDGTVYPCSQAVGQPGRSAGSVAVVDWAALQSQFRTTRLSGPCDDCVLAGRCPGDCPSRIEAGVGPHDGESMPHESITCRIYRTIATAERTRP